MGRVENSDILKQPKMMKTEATNTIHGMGNISEYCYTKEQGVALMYF